jgi:hypothetical protein
MRGSALMTHSRADTAKGDTTLSPVKQLRESKDSNALLKAQLERANAERIGLMHSLNQETLARKQGEKMNRELSKQLHSPQQKTAEVELELVLTELQSEKRKLELLRGTLTPVGASVSPMPAPRSPTASPARAARSVERRAPSQPNNEELAEGMASSVAGLALGQYTAAEHRAAVMTEALHELQAPHCAADPNPRAPPALPFSLWGLSVAEQTHHGSPRARSVPEAVGDGGPSSSNGPVRRGRQARRAQD